MQKGDYLSTVLRSTKTVLTLKDIALLWQDSDTKAARVRLNYYVKNKDLYRIRRGIYAKSKEYNKFELATRIFTPAYISFETVLVKEGVIFQYQTPITIASYLTREIGIEGQIYSYKKIKDEILMNSTGVEFIQETSIATKERAFLDMLYSVSDYHFDNLRSLSWETVYSLVQIYDNQRLKKTVDRLYSRVKTNE